MLLLEIDKFGSPTDARALSIDRILLPIIWMFNILRHNDFIILSRRVWQGKQGPSNRPCPVMNRNDNAEFHWFFWRDVSSNLPATFIESDIGEICDFVQNFP